MLSTLYIIALISPSTYKVGKFPFLQMRKVKATITQQSWNLNQGLTLQYYAISWESDMFVMGKDSKKGMTPLF